MTSTCTFCQIAAGEEAAEIIWQDDAWIAIKNKYPKAPVHVLVMPKQHVVKKDKLFGDGQEFWGAFMMAVGSVIQELGLDKTGYQLVNNGAGYNHFEHEHMHIVGGSPKAPFGE